MRSFGRKLRCASFAPHSLNVMRHEQALCTDCIFRDVDCNSHRRYLVRDSGRVPAVGCGRRRVPTVCVPERIVGIQVCRPTAHARREEASTVPEIYLPSDRNP